MYITVKQLANKINNLERFTFDELKPEEKTLVSEKIYQRGKACGYIELKTDKANYKISVFLFGCSVPVESEIVAEYSLALHKLTIKRNKYSY